MSVRPLCLLAVLLLLLPALGCATQHSSYAPDAAYDPRSATEDDIRQALDAAPQLHPPVKVAWYNMGTDSLLASLMHPDPGVTLHYEIPKSLVEGARPHFAPRSPYQRYGAYYTQPRAVDPKALRLLAARAKCDVLVLVGSRFEEQRDENGWAILNIAILPAFFTPFLDVKYHHEAEALVFDVRNGYLYKHAKSVSDEKRRLTMYELEKTSKRMENDLREKARKHLDGEVYALFR